MNEEFAIILNSVTYCYGEQNAINNVTLSIKKGEIFGIVGPDGAGKTTIIRMLCGLLKPSSGEIYILGFNTITEKRSIHKRIGYLSQRFSLYGDLTVDENIDFFAQIHGVKDYKKRKNELLEFTRLTPFRKRLAEKLSGGMKQKLALACTLIHSPEIIFLDEPTTGVDPVSRRDFWKILNELLTTRLTIVMSTPYLDEAERCSRIALINKGKILLCNPPKAIKMELKNKFVEIVCSPIREATIIGRGNKDFLSVNMFGDRIHIQYEEEKITKEEIKEFFQKNSIEVKSIRELMPSLEDVFIHYISQEE